MINEFGALGVCAVIYSPIIIIIVIIIIIRIRTITRRSVIKGEGTKFNITSIDTSEVGHPPEEHIQLHG